MDKKKFYEYLNESIKNFLLKGEQQTCKAIVEKEKIM